MASKLPKCTKYPHHKWRWVGNNTQGYLSKTITRITKKGVYECDCGAIKEGKPQ